MSSSSDRRAAAEQHVSGRGKHRLLRNIDLAECIEPKQFHDVVGYYNRFDIFRLEVDRSANRPVVFRDDPEPVTVRGRAARAEPERVPLQAARPGEADVHLIDA